MASSSTSQNQQLSAEVQDPAPRNTDAGQPQLESADAGDTASGQLDLFVMDALVDVSIKDDLSSMEHPIFSLSKNKDTRLREYSRGGRILRIIPSTVGAATVFDKDILIYALSQIVAAEDKGLRTSRRVRIETHPFLAQTQRSTGGAAYERIIDMCRRLKGTILETNIRTNEEEQTKGFSLIEDYSVTRKTKNGKGALEVEITLSDWFYRAAKAFHVLTLHRNYFALSMPLERRLYELARMHCGNDKAYFSIGIDGLHKKTGTTQELKYFRRELNQIMDADRIPEYRVLIDESTRPAKVVFATRDNKKLLHSLRENNKLDWYSKLVQRKTGIAKKEES